MQTQVSTTHRRAPSPLSLRPLGHLAAIDRAPLSFFQESQRRYGDVVRLRLGHLPAHLIFHPQDIARVLSDNNRNYTKGTPLIGSLKLLMGEGVLTSENPLWLRQRRIMQPAFHRQRIHGFGAQMVRATEQMLEQWRSRRQAFDVREQLLQLTLRISSEVLLGSTTAMDADVLRNTGIYSNAYIYSRARKVLPSPLWVPTRENRTFKYHLAALDALVYRVIAARKQAAERGEEASDFLSLLLAARDQDTGEGMSDRQLRDEVVTAMVAGHETTANALSWALHLLDQSPRVAARLRSEVDSVIGSGPFDPDAIARMPYLRQVLDEAMRMYPPGWIITRIVHHDDEISGFHIPKGSFILMSPYITHRHPEFWPDPDHFDPDRFAPEQAASRSRFAYIPFGVGPRVCIGNNMALMEMLIILACLTRAVELRGMPGKQVVVQPHFTLGPKELLATCSFRQPPSALAPNSRNDAQSGATLSCPVAH